MPVENVVDVVCGRWWEGVRLPTFVGLRVLSRLRERSGPVIEDRVAESMTWLVRVGAAEGWERLAPGTHVLRAGWEIAVPPVGCVGGPWEGGASLRWLSRPTATCLTHPPDLLDALRHVLPGGTGAARA
ncbi:hypothetical protein [Streptomyces marincola]|uniref:hypothetical protein n=1 Tax=Streptomyces marincola TaxID=2878388 RepID=UPI00131C218F|nr:hypothetical protein [Streptomyces marincola]